MAGETRAVEPLAGTTGEAMGTTRAFAAVRCRDRSWVVDLPLGEATLIGPCPPALVTIESIGAQGRIAWDGRSLFLRELRGGPDLFVAGKRIDGRIELKPGDEVTIGPAHLVVGMSSPNLPAARRALTHQEFRERVAEELARAARGGRSTSLVMTRARNGEGGALLATALERFRAGDVVASYAPDEIELLLPDTSRDRAVAVVERVLRSGGIEGAVIACAVAPGDADHPERLMRAVRTELRARLEPQGRRTLPRGVDDEPMLEDAASREVARELDERAAAPGPVLLVGEPSAGKVAFARRAHRRSSPGPLIVLGCARNGDPAALDQALAEAATARGGTLILDEVSELAPDAQARWLPVLRSLEDATRLFVTTQRDLRVLAERGAFSRELAEWLLARRAIVVPPLRQRPDDIVPLATRFAEDVGASAPVRFSTGALARLRSYSWPANVLELRNAIERAVQLAGGGEILAEHLPAESLVVVAADGRLREHVDSVERDAIVKALAESNHNQTHAAKRLGLSRRALIYKMEKYGLKQPPGTQRRRDERG